MTAVMISFIHPFSINNFVTAELDQAVVRNVPEGLNLKTLDNVLRRTVYD